MDSRGYFRPCGYWGRFARTTGGPHLEERVPTRLGWVHTYDIFIIVVMTPPSVTICECHFCSILSQRHRANWARTYYTAGRFQSSRIASHNGKAITLRSWHISTCTIQCCMYEADSLINNVFRESRPVRSIPLCQTPFRPYCHYRVFYNCEKSSVYGYKETHALIFSVPVVRYGPQNYCRNIRTHSCLLQESILVVFKFLHSLFFFSGFFVVRIIHFFVRNRFYYSINYGILLI